MRTIKLLTQYGDFVVMRRINEYANQKLPDAVIWGNRLFVHWNPEKAEYREATCQWIVDTQNPTPALPGQGVIPGLEKTDDA